MTRAARSGVVGSLMEKADFRKTEEAKKKANAWRIKRDQRDLYKMISGISSSFNPFDRMDDNNLYSISTGKAVPEDIKKDLTFFHKESQKLIHLSPGALRMKVHLTKQ